MSIAIKLHVAQEVRRFSIAKELSFAEFTAFVSQKLLPSLKEHHSELSFAYVDNDKDWVQVTLEVEWQEALNVASQTSNTLVIRVSRTVPAAQQKAEQAKPPQEQTAAHGNTAWKACQKQQPQQQQGSRWCGRRQGKWCSQQSKQQETCDNGYNCSPRQNFFFNMLRGMFGAQESCGQGTESGPSRWGSWCNKNQQGWCSGRRQGWGWCQNKQQQQQQQAQSWCQNQGNTQGCTKQSNDHAEQGELDNLLYGEQEKQQQPQEQQEEEVFYPQNDDGVEVIEVQEEKRDFQQELNNLANMGFTNTKLNEHLLKNFHGNTSKVIEALLAIKQE